MRTRTMLAALAVLIPAVALAAIVTDDFNRANGAVGANWTATDETSTGLQIVSNQVTLSGSTARNASRWTGDSFGGDQFSEIELMGFDASPAAAHIVTVGCRMSGTWETDVDGYTASIRIDLGQYNIGRWDNASFTSLSGGLQNLASLNVNDVFRIECEGTTISFFQNDTLVDDATDATYSTGAPEVSMFIATGDDPLSVDNFRGGERCLACLMHYYRMLRR